MNLFEYNIDNIKEYEIDIWSNACCSSLCEINISGQTVYFNAAGFQSLEDYLVHMNNEGITDRFCRMLSALRMIVDAVRNSRQYLIDEHDISFDPKMIWIRDKKAYLLPGHHDEDLIHSLSILTEALGYSEISEKILQRQAESLLSEKALLSFLSKWELELRE